jgi:deoxycytidylate deaminase
MTWNSGIQIADATEMDRFLMKLAYQWAWQNSHDTVTKTGALVFNPSLQMVVARGANRFPEGLAVTPELVADRTWKYRNIVHAERAAVEQAGRNAQGAILYSPWTPCSDCAQHIIASGISLYYAHRETVVRSPERWVPDLEKALEMMEGKVAIRLLQGEIGNVYSLFNGEQWEP